MQTEVVQRVRGCTARSHSTIGESGVARARVPNPPGTTTTSGAGTSAKVCSTSRCTRSLSSLSRPAAAAQSTTSSPGTWLRTW